VQLKSKFPKLTQSIFGLSEFWGEFRQIMAMDGRHSHQNSVQKWTESVLEICSSILHYDATAERLCPFSLLGFDRNTGWPET